MKSPLFLCQEIIRKNSLRKPSSEIWVSPSGAGRRLPRFGRQSQRRWHEVITADQLRLNFDLGVWWAPWWCDLSLRPCLVAVNSGEGKPWVRYKLKARHVVVLFIPLTRTYGQPLSLCRCWWALRNQCTQTGIRVTQDVLKCIIHHQTAETQ